MDSLAFAWAPRAELGFYSLHNRSLTDWTFFPMIVLTFYKDILTTPHRVLSRELIRRVLSYLRGEKMRVNQSRD